MVSKVLTTNTGGTNTATYTVSYKSYTVKTNFGCSGIAEYNATQNLVDKITLPDGSYYQFAYEATAGGSSGQVTGRLASVSLPTGGSISYTYPTINGGANNAINCSDGSAPIAASGGTSLTRVVNPGGTWQYSRKDVSASHYQTTVTDPTSAANQTQIDFQEDSSGHFYETQRFAYQGSVGGTALSQAVTCYNQSGSGLTPSSCSPSTAVTTPFTRVTSFSCLPTCGSGSVSETDTQYGYISDPNYPTEVDSYDYGPNNPGSLLRKVLTTYNEYGSNIQPTNVTSEDGSGNVAAVTTYSYDQTTPQPTSNTPQHTSISGGRGNLTTLATQISSGLTLYRIFSYYDTGNVYQSSDAGTSNAGGSNLTTYTYGDCGNSFVSAIAEPLNLSKSFVWDCNGGVMTSMTDENGQSSGVYYTGSYFNKSADPDYWRPYASTDQLGNATTFSYPNPTASESTLLFNSNNSVVDKRVTLDGFGRPIVNQTEQGPGVSNYDSTETDYDVAGRISKGTVPYSAGAGGTCSGCAATATTYDALNRPTVVTDGGGGTVNYSYTNNAVTQTVGPAPGSQKELEYDGLGRLSSVCEITAGTTSWPNGACNQPGGPKGYLTAYTYDVLGDLTGVTQNAQASTTQTRSYTFDMLGRMTQETNPESGTTTYKYDISDSVCSSYSSAGDLVEKIDSVGNISCLKYDNLHRVTQITYQGSYASRTPTKCFVYDSATVNGTAMKNAATRLAEAYTTSAASCPGTKIVDEGFSYSARGEITDTWESTPNSGGYYHPAVTYWANGALKSLWISTLPAITYGPNGEGRPNTVSASSGQNPVTGTTYNVFGQPTGVTFGSGDSDGFTFDGNTGRMTKYTYTVSGSSEVGNLTWNPSGSLKTLAITDPFNSGDNQTCSYSHDDMARLASVSCGSAWSQTFSYDPFGNITKTGSISWQPGYNVGNKYTLTGTRYDSNGNLTKDTFQTYTWDADGNPDTISSVSLTYDAFDRVVEQNKSGTYYQVVYTPMGSKLGVFKAQVMQQLYVPLPGGTQAEYYSWGLSDYRHPDWLGSDRMEASPSHSILDNNAYAPFGEPYAQTGNGEISFTGQNKDTVWLQYDFLARQYDPKQGRWISPDPAGVAAVDPANPQTWNRYAYVMNNPMSYVDPWGLEDGCPYSACVTGVGSQAPSFPMLACSSGGTFQNGQCIPGACQGAQGTVSILPGMTICGPPSYGPYILSQIQNGQCASSGCMDGGGGGGNGTPVNPPPKDGPKPLSKWDKTILVIACLAGMPPDDAKPIELRHSPSDSTDSTSGTEGQGAPIGPNKVGQPVSYGGSPAVPGGAANGAAYGSSVGQCIMNVFTAWPKS